jgi:hypothetical protein
MKNAVFWDVAPCSLCEPTFRRIVSPSSSLQLLAHADSSLADSSTLKMEAVRASEASVYTKTTRRHIQENGILHILLLPDYTAHSVKLVPTSHSYQPLQGLPPTRNRLQNLFQHSFISYSVPTVHSIFPDSATLFCTKRNSGPFLTYTYSFLMLPSASRIWGHYATSRKVAGPIPDEVIGFFFFNLHNPSNLTMALGSTQSLTEMITQTFLWTKGGRRLRLKSPPSVSRLS